MSESTPLQDPVEDLLVSVLARAGGPLAALALRRALPAGMRPPVKGVLAHLHALAAAGRIHPWPGKTERYAAVDARALAREQVQQALAAGPLTEVEVKRRVPKAVQPLVKDALAGLVAEGVVQHHPKLGARMPCGLGPPDPLDYLRPEIEAVFKRLVKRGFKEAALRAALGRYGTGPEGAAVGAGPARPAAPAGLPGPAADAEVIAAILRLNSQASRGALVYVADLRAALAGRLPGKEAFDRAILALAERGKVQLQSHAWPGRLSEAEKAALVPNGRGGYFDAIGLRLE
jgi:hypothetical protein